jgi:hypothetical protein
MVIGPSISIRREALGPVELASNFGSDRDYLQTWCSLLVLNDVTVDDPLVKEQFEVVCIRGVPLASERSEDAILLQIKKWWRWTVKQVIGK